MEFHAASGTMPGIPPCSARLYVDTGAIRYNLKALQACLPPETKIMPVLKADAYGAGLSVLANTLSHLEQFAVADAKEAVLLRRARPDAKILTLYQPASAEIPYLASGEFSVAVCDLDFLMLLNREARKRHKVVPVHVEIETGMGRLGVPPEGVPSFARAAKELSSVRIEGIFSHYAAGDSLAHADQEYTRLQTERFLSAVSEFEAVYGTIPYKHSSASFSGILHPDARFQFVRPGYLLYGYYGNPGLSRYIKLRPALRFASTVLYIKKVPTGSPIGYERTFVTQRDSLIATVACGYADGVSRLLSNQGFFVVNGQRAPIVGRVCMDLTTLDVTDVSGRIHAGDEVFLFDNEAVTLEEIASLCGTNGYEILTRIDTHVEKIVV